MLLLSLTDRWRPLRGSGWAQFNTATTTSMTNGTGGGQPVPGYLDFFGGGVGVGEGFQKENRNERVGVAEWGNRGARLPPGCVEQE